MNKLTLSCLQSLVQTRPKGDWDFLTKLILIWPEAKNYYWKKQGFRNLLSSWPFIGAKPCSSGLPYLWLPEGWIAHGFTMFQGFYSIIWIYHQGDYIMKLVARSQVQGNIATWTHQDMQVRVYQYPQNCVLLNMNPMALDLQYKEFPWVQQNVIKALKLARDLGKTDIKTLNTLAALTSEA